MDWGFLNDTDYHITTFGDVPDEARAWSINTNATLPDSITMAPRGGCVVKIVKD
jgi:hypothetical protein